MLTDRDGMYVRVAPSRARSFRLSKQALNRDTP